MSGLAILRDPLVNEDGVLFLVQAEAILSGGMASALQVFGLSLYSVLIAGVQVLTGLGSMASAQLLDASLLALLTVSFAQLLELLGAERRFFFWGALALLLFPRLNEYRGHIAEDLGFWAFLIASLVPLTRYLSHPRWRHALGWALLTAAGAAFRPEALLFGAVLPLACLARTTEAPRGEAMLRLYAAALGLAALPLVAAARFGFMPPLADAVFGSIRDLVQEVRTGFGHAATQYAAHVLNSRARELTYVSLATGLFAVLMVELARSLGLAYLALLGWAGVTRRALLPESGRGLQRTLALGGAIMAAAFLAGRQFVGARQLMPLCLALIIPCAFAARELLISAAHSTKPLAARAGLALLVLALLAAGFLDPGSRRSYLPESISWIQRSITPGSHIFTNDARLAYYSGGRVDWAGIGSAQAQIESGAAPREGNDYWLIHLDGRDTALEPALERYRSTLEPIARFGAPGGAGVLVMRSLR